MTKSLLLVGIKVMAKVRAGFFLIAWILVSGNCALASPEMGAFMEEHCFKCHGPEKQEGKLRFDTLDGPSASGEEGETWLLVLDALEAGEMPPEDEQQPHAKVLEGVVQSLGKVLAETTELPIGLRRLNRTEYEYTIHDLLGIETPLRDLLPEDSSVAGFDNVSAGLGISAVLMERYLEAADVAFQSAIRRFAPQPAETRRLIVMERKDNIDSVEKKKGGVIEVEGSLVKFTPGWPPVRVDEVHPIEDGLYRCRIAVWPYQPGGRTLSLAIYVGPLFGTGRRDFVGMFDVTGTPEKPRVIEFEAELKEGETMHIIPWIYPEHVTWRDKHEKQPGIGVAWAETHGPLNQDFPADTQKRLFGEQETLAMETGTPIWMRHRKGVKSHEVVSSSPEADAERIIRGFSERAFRRPVEKEAADPFVELTLERLRSGRTFEQAVRAGVSAVLCAPQFLLLNREEEVDDYAIASRLSYFLWSSMPDEELLRLAAEGKLGDPKVRDEQVERMLKSPLSERFVKNFTGQWLDLREIEFTSPSTKLYPEFDPLLQESMLRESWGFFRHLLDQDLSVMNFVDSDFAFLNERMARHYEIEGVTGHEHSRVVKLPEESIRGGVMAQASVLKVSANGTTTSPVLRGVWLLDHLLDQSVPPPPPGVPAVEPDIRGATSIRDQLAQHSSDPSCARCHQHIDPPGFALENFDPIGGERSWYRSLGEGQKISKSQPYTIGQDVESDGEMTDGSKFQDFREFRALLMKREDQIARGIARKLLLYGTGRPLTIADRESVEAVVKAAQEKGLGLRSMIHAVVESPMFHRR